MEPSAQYEVRTNVQLSTRLVVKIKPQLADVSERWGATKLLLCPDTETVRHRCRSEVSGYHRKRIVNCWNGPNLNTIDIPKYDQRHRE